MRLPFHFRYVISSASHTRTRRQPYLYLALAAKVNELAIQHRMVKNDSPSARILLKPEHPRTLPALVVVNSVRAFSVFLADLFVSKKSRSAVKQETQRRFFLALGTVALIEDLVTLMRLVILSIFNPLFQSLS